MANNTKRIKYFDLLRAFLALSVLLYPSNPNFQKPLEDFICEGELILKVIPFNLKNVLSKNDEKKEVMGILKSTSNSLDYIKHEFNLSIAADSKIDYA